MRRPRSGPTATATATNRTHAGGAPRSAADRLYTVPYRSAPSEASAVERVEVLEVVLGQGEALPDRRERVARSDGIGRRHTVRRGRRPGRVGAGAVVGHDETRAGVRHVPGQRCRREDGGDAPVRPGGARSPSRRGRRRCGGRTGRPRRDHPRC